MSSWNLPNLPLRGTWDTASLLGLSLGAAAAHPLACGNPTLALLGLSGVALGSAGLVAPRVRAALDPVNTQKREGFVLRSDPLLDVAPDAGILVGYTKDTGEAVRVPYDLLMRHIALMGAVGGR
jgi:hypothetical protein